MVQINEDFNLFKYSAHFLALFPDTSNLPKFNQQFFNFLKSLPETESKNFIHKNYFRLRNKYLASESLQDDTNFNFLPQKELEKFFQEIYLPSLEKFNLEKLNEIGQNTISNFNLTNQLNYSIYIDLLAPLHTASNNGKMIFLSLKNNQELNWSGFKHELIHLILNTYHYPKINFKLPVSKDYEEDNNLIKFKEYLANCLTIYFGNFEAVKTNLDNYEQAGFLQIKKIYQKLEKLLKNNKFNQIVIDQLVLNFSDNYLLS